MFYSSLSLSSYYLSCFLFNAIRLLFLFLLLTEWCIWISKSALAARPRSKSINLCLPAAIRVNSPALCFIFESIAKYKHWNHFFFSALHPPFFIHSLIYSTICLSHIVCCLINHFSFTVYYSIFWNSVVPSIPLYGKPAKFQ